ncbi:hypothetical protein [Amycolatopsis xylanica]|uniref:hypothetical protein n=1 Tax=Amycolatopsis xylanica TaxID=589385 RepID=UPI000B88854B|nr:hypothetical protein [Amycolatopsis xylanica]
MNPFLSITVLECVGDDVDVAFKEFQRFLRKTANDRGRANAVNVWSERTVGAREVVDEVGVLGDFGFDGLFFIARELVRVPGWASKESGLADVCQQLMMALRRNRLVAVYGEVPSSERLQTWVRRTGTFRFVSQPVLAATFNGDARMVWMRGMHRRRLTKPDSKALGGQRVQDTLDGLDDSTFALAAAKFFYEPVDDKALLREVITVNPAKSTISWKRTSDFPMFLAAAGEALDMLELGLVSEAEPEPPFVELAIPETDLGKVRDAFEISVADVDGEQADSAEYEELAERAELLRSAIVAVREVPDSSGVLVEVGLDGAVAGTLLLKPIKVGDGVQLDVRYSDAPSAEPIARRIKEAIGDGDLLTVHYQSGHAFNNRQVFRENLKSDAFPNLVFEDFTGYRVTKEKPALVKGKSLHDVIGEPGDDSLFAWVVKTFDKGWLLCDDGAGEVADFLHLAEDGTLTAIHVKAAGSHSPDRRIAVTAFEEVVSQTVKNIRRLRTDDLLARFDGPLLATRAAWHDGVRVAGADFLDELKVRVPSDHTKVIIVQPHLLASVHDTAREAARLGKTTRDSASLALLDDLLHRTRKSVVTLWADLMVIGSA